MCVRKLVKNKWPLPSTVNVQHSPSLPTYWLLAPSLPLPQSHCHLESYSVMVGWPK